MVRIGHGYDVHRLAEGRKLILGGVEIPYEKGLQGHSDADVLVHAIMDSMLGALALGDIGKHFPDNDPEYEGADSILLLKNVSGIIEKNGFGVGNIDKMRKNIAAAVGCEISRVSVKATTEERLGFTGTGEGIAAHAVCILEAG